MSCNPAQQQQVVVHMVQIEGMVAVEEGVVAVVAMVEMVHGIDRTEAVVAQLYTSWGIRSVFYETNLTVKIIWLQRWILLYVAPLTRSY